MIVLDASAILEWLKWSEMGRRADPFIQDPSESLHAPHLIDLEVASALRRWTQKAGLADDVATDSLNDFASLCIHRHGHHGLLPRIWGLRSNLTAYDAAYIALAEALEAPLVTADARLLEPPRPAPRPLHGARIHYLGE